MDLDGLSSAKITTTFKGEGHTHAAIRDSIDWTDFTLETKINLIRGTIHVNFRAILGSLEDRYLLSISRGGLFLSKSPAYHTIVRSEIRPLLYRWNTLAVEAIGGSIKIYLNGVLKIDYTDPEPLKSCGISLESLDGSKVYVDDVIVTTPKINQ